jgi:hypothetical protein
MLSGLQIDSETHCGRHLSQRDKPSRVSLPALKQIHLNSTCRLNGAALVGIIGQEARRLDRLANMSSDNARPRL